MSTPPIIEIRRTPGRFFAILFASLAVAAAGITALIFETPPVARWVSVLAAGLAFAAAGVAALRLSQLRTPVVTISTDGIRDLRIAPETIPWSDIKAVSTAEESGARVVVLTLDDVAERRLTLTGIARMTRHPHRGPAPEGLYLRSAGLDMDFDALLRLIKERRG